MTVSSNVEGLHSTPDYTPVVLVNSPMTSHMRRYHYTQVMYLFYSMPSCTGLIVVHIIFCICTYFLCLETLKIDDAAQANRSLFFNPSEQSRQPTQACPTGRGVQASKSPQATPATQARVPAICTLYTPTRHSIRVARSLWPFRPAPFERSKKPPRCEGFFPISHVDFLGLVRTTLARCLHVAKLNRRLCYLNSRFEKA